MKHKIKIRIYSSYLALGSIALYLSADDVNITGFTVENGGIIW